MPGDLTDLTSINVALDWKVVGSRRSSSSTTPKTPETKYQFISEQQLSSTPKESISSPVSDANTLFYKRYSLVGLDIPEFQGKKSVPPPPGLTSPIHWKQPSWNGTEPQRDIPIFTPMNNQRQIRSLSMQGQTFNQRDGFAGEPVTHEPLRGGDEDEDDYTSFSLPKMRSRSKSSSAIFGHLESENGHQQQETNRQQRYSDQKDPNYPDMNSIWAMSQNMPSSAAQAAAAAAAQAAASVNEQASLRAGHEPALLHRRASTQPSYAPVWENMRPPNQQQLQDSRNESSDHYRPIRRFSHAPSAYADYQQTYVNRTMTFDPQYEQNRRRHSVAATPFNGNARYLSEAMENLQIAENGSADTPANIAQSAQDAALFHGVDDYFENTEHRTRAWVEAGENLQQMSQQPFSNPTSPNASVNPPVLQYQQQQHRWPLYVVEFKAGRTDFFYVDERTSGNNLPPKLVKGDLVIVEADRGTDLGKVIFDNIMNMQQLQMYQSSNSFSQYAQGEDGQVRDVHPKRIIRLAHANDVGMLVAKSQDEAKAVGVCQNKIRQRRLPMEVVDAEYQWDRKKLTFYFVADRRIDFRELVRELFKLYKTRIWMCAVNPAKQ